MRVAVDRIGAQARPFRAALATSERRRCTVDRSGRSATMPSSRISEDAHARIQRRKRILENDLHLAPRLMQLVAFELHRAAGRRAWLRLRCARCRAAAAGPPCRSWSCRSPTRRPAPACARRARSNETPSTALTYADGALQAALADRKVDAVVAHLQQRRAPTGWSGAARAVGASAGIAGAGRRVREAGIRRHPGLI